MSPAFKEGYSINKLNTSPKKDYPEKINFDKLYYPNGIIPFVTITVLYVIALIVVLSVASQKTKLTFPLYWHNYIVAVSGASLCLNLLWWISRSGIFNSFSYVSMKISRVTRFSTLKEKIHITPINAALKEVNSLKDFNEYITNRQKRTKKWLYISFITHTSIFIISLIIFLIIEFI